MRMTKTLTPKQAKFTEVYLETGNATEAADRAYKPKNRNTAHAIGAENLRKPTIKDFLEKKGLDAASMVYKLSQEAKSEAVRLGASKDILDRAGYGATAKLHASIENVSTTPESLNRYKELRERYEADLLKQIGESSKLG
jgi:phage terminase small subunit